MFGLGPWSQDIFKPLTQNNMETSKEFLSSMKKVKALAYVEAAAIIVVVSGMATLLASFIY